MEVGGEREGEGEGEEGREERRDGAAARLPPALAAGPAAYLPVPLPSYVGRRQGMRRSCLAWLGTAARPPPCRAAGTRRRLYPALPLDSRAHV